MIAHSRFARYRDLMVAHNCAYRVLRQSLANAVKHEFSPEYTSKRQGRCISCSLFVDGVSHDEPTNLVD